MICCVGIFWVVRMERDRRFFEGARNKEVWNKVYFWPSLWAAVSSEFRDNSFHEISYDWNAVVS